MYHQSKQRQGRPSPGIVCAILLSGLFWVPQLSAATFAFDAERSKEHRARDSGRKPKEVLELAFGSELKGKKIADIVPGGGYYTAILSRLVGDAGRIHAINPTRIFQAFPDAAANFPKYLAEDPRLNIHYSVQKLDEIIFPEELDGALMALYYHDTLWTGVDRARMNQLIYHALAPGAHFLIIDHHAADEAPENVPQSLHRMRATIAKQELLAAGFEMLIESDLLENSHDPLNQSVFEPTLRGKTHRFVFVMRKPAT